MRSPCVLTLPLMLQVLFSLAATGHTPAAIRPASSADIPHNVLVISIVPPVASHVTRITMSVNKAGDCGERLARNRTGIRIRGLYQ